MTQVKDGREIFTENVPEGLRQDGRDARRLEEYGTRPLCGSYVERVVLPDTVTAAGSLAFYNCTGAKGAGDRKRT